MKIIVAVDGTVHSEVAISALTSTAWPADTEIKILTVAPAEEPAFAFARFGAPNRTAEQQAQLIETTKNALKEMVGPRAAALNCKISFEVLQGDAKSQIVEEAKKWSANMIVMGSRGSKGIELALLGSVSQSVLNLAPCPVVIVKTQQGAGSYDFKQGFRSIVVAVDNSEYSQAAMKWVKDFPWSESCKVKLVTVIPHLANLLDGHPDGLDMTEVMMKQETIIRLAENELKKLSAELLKFKRENVSNEVVVGDPREAILQTAENVHADLIVMGSHGRTGLTKLFIGSVSQAVAAHAPSSVAVVRGVVPKGKIGALNQSGLFVANNKDEYDQKYKELTREMEDLSK